MRVGVDTYSYHRLLGELRRGESAPAEAMADPVLDPVRDARRLGIDVLSMETCYLGDPSALDVDALRAALGPIEPILAWGHPLGLAFGADPAATAGCLAWVGVAAALRGTRMRIVVGGPALREPGRMAEPIRAVAPVVRGIAERAAQLGVAIAIENHGDLTATELLDLTDLIGDGLVGVCFDTANAARVGDDVLAAAVLLADRVRMVHLKDIADPSMAADPVSGPASTPYGEGVIPLAAVLEALADPIAAGAPVCVEIAQLPPGADERRLVDDGVRWLRARP